MEIQVPLQIEYLTNIIEPTLVFDEVKTVDPAINLYVYLYDTPAYKLDPMAIATIIGNVTPVDNGDGTFTAPSTCCIFSCYMALGQRLQAIDATMPATTDDLPVSINIQGTNYTNIKKTIIPPTESTPATPVWKIKIPPRRIFKDAFFFPNGSYAGGGGGGESPNTPARPKFKNSRNTLINASAHQIKFTIEGSDYSQLVTDFEAGYGMIDESGIIGIEGSATLRNTVKDNRNLDDRVGTKFAKGNRVNATSKAGTMPFGTLRIREATYTPKGRILTLEFCDLLTLLMQNGDDKETSDTCVGEPRLVTEVINELLQKAGAPPMSGSIPGWVVMPTTGGNYIEVAGALAWSRGYCLMITAPEKVIPIKVDLKPTGGGMTRATNRLIDYERASTGESPPYEITVKGNVDSIKLSIDDNGDVEYGTTNITEYSHDKILTIRETIKGNNRKITTTLYESSSKVIPWLSFYGGLLLSEKKVENFHYVDRVIRYTPLDPDSPDTKMCPDGIEKVLKNKETIIIQPYSKVLSSWVTQHKLDNSKNIVYTDSFGGTRTTFVPHYSSIVAYKERTNYDYAYDSTGNRMGGLYNPPVTQIPGGEEDQTEIEPIELKTQDIHTEKYEPQGKIFPKGYMIDGNTVTFPAELTQSGFERQEWYRVPGAYAHHELVMQSYCLYDSQSADQGWEAEKAAKNGTGLDPRRYTALVTASDKLTVSSAGQAEPPAPETLSGRSKSTNSKDKEYKIKVKSKFINPGMLEPPPKTYNIEYPIADMADTFRALELENGRRKAALKTFEKQAQILGEIYMGLAWGRYKGIEITIEMGVTGVYKPLAPFTVIEETGAHSYLMDGLAIAWSKDRFYAKVKGIWTGGLK